MTLGVLKNPLPLSLTEKGILRVRQSTSEVLTSKGFDSVGILNPLELSLAFSGFNPLKAV